MFEKEIALGMDLFTDAAIARIDLTQLDMRDTRRCVLGQLYGDYSEGLASLCLTYYNAGQFGFCIDPAQGTCYDQRVLFHKVLTLEWAVAIIERRLGLNIARRYLPEASELADDLKVLDEAMEADLDLDTGGATRTITRRRRLWEKPSR